MVVADGGVEVGDLIAGVGDDQVAGRARAGEVSGAFDRGGVHDDMAPAGELVEHGGGVVSGAHSQGELGVGGVGEPMDGLQGDHGGGVGVGDGVVEGAAAADGGELVAVSDERDPGAGLVGDREQGVGGVLVEHPGLVDEQQIPRIQVRGWRGCGVRVAGPVAVAVPPPPVLVDQPRCGVAVGAGLGGGNLRPLQCGRDHHHPLATLGSAALESIRGWWSSRLRRRPRRLREVHRRRGARPRPLGWGRHGPSPGRPAGRAWAARSNGAPAGRSGRLRRRGPGSR